MTEADTESPLLAPLKRRVLRMIPPSSLLSELVGTLRDLRLTRSNTVASSIRLSTLTYEQAIRSRAEIEIRKAQAVDWYFRQKSKMI